LRKMVAAPGMRERHRALPQQNTFVQSRSDILFMSDLFLRLRDHVPQRGRRIPDPILGLRWPYKLTDAPTAREINGYVVEDISDPKDASVPTLRTPQSCC
jgi:hypothetical protein